MRVARSVAVLAVAGTLVSAEAATAKAPNIYPGQKLVCLVWQVPKPNGRPGVKMRCHVVGKRRKHGPEGIVLHFIEPPAGSTGATS